MSVNSGRGHLAGLTKQLDSQWQQTREYWRDAKSQEFDRKYMSELSSIVNAAVNNTEDLGKIIAKIRSDCE